MHGGFASRQEEVCLSQNTPFEYLVSLFFFHILQASRPESRAREPARAESKPQAAKGWGANIGGQLSSLMGSISKDMAKADGRTSSTESRLRGLFQRPNPSANLVAGFHDTPKGPPYTAYIFLLSQQLDWV